MPGEGPQAPQSRSPTLQNHKKVIYIISAAESAAGQTNSGQRQSSGTRPWKLFAHQPRGLAPAEFSSWALTL